MVGVGEAEIPLGQIQGLPDHRLGHDIAVLGHRDGADPGHEVGQPGNDIGDFDALDPLQKHLDRVVRTSQKADGTRGADGIEVLQPGVIILRVPQREDRQGLVFPAEGMIDRRHGTRMVGDIRDDDIREDNGIFYRQDRQFIGTARIIHNPCKPQSVECFVLLQLP